MCNYKCIRLVCWLKRPFFPHSLYSLEVCQIDFTATNNLDLVPDVQIKPLDDGQKLAAWTSGAAAGLHNHRVFGQPVLNTSGAGILSSLSGLSANTQSMVAIASTVGFCQHFNWLQLQWLWQPAKSVPNFTARKKTTARACVALPN